MSEEIEAGSKFLREFDKRFPVAAAFWAQRSDDGRLSLYVASSQVNDRNFRPAIGELIEIGKMLQDPNFDIYRVKFIRVDEPMAKAAIEIMRPYSGRIARHFRGQDLGGISLEEAYIYPMPVSVP